MKDVVTDPKQKAILESAWQTFATYGFRKTSMDDIARGAGMSRPALYLHYRNKEDIFRNLVLLYYDRAYEDVSQALETEGSPTDILTRAFEAHLGEAMEAMFNSPHGHELLDTGAQTAMDIKEQGEARLKDLYADWLTRWSTAGHIAFDGDAADVAMTIGSALKGVKNAAEDYPMVVSQVHALAALLGAGLRAP